MTRTIKVQPPSDDAALTPRVHNTVELSRTLKIAVRGSNIEGSHEQHELFSLSP